MGQHSRAAGEGKLWDVFMVARALRPALCALLSFLFGPISQTCPPGAGNDAGTPARPQTLGTVSLATPAPGLQVLHFTKKKFAALIRSSSFEFCSQSEICKAASSAYSASAQTSEAIVPIGSS